MKGSPSSDAISKDGMKGVDDVTRSETECRGFRGIGRVEGLRVAEGFSARNSNLLRQAFDFRKKWVLGGRLRSHLEEDSKPRITKRRVCRGGRGLK